VVMGVAFMMKRGRVGRSRTDMEGGQGMF